MARVERPPAEQVPPYESEFFSGVARDGPCRAHLDAPFRGRVVGDRRNKFRPTLPAEGLAHGGDQAGRVRIVRTVQEDLGGGMVRRMRTLRAECYGDTALMPKTISIVKLMR